MEQAKSFTIRYQVTHTSENGDCAEIVGVVTPLEGQKLLILSLEIDGIELLPSFRVEFIDNSNVTLPAIKVFQPIAGRKYQVTLVEYADSSSTRHESEPLVLL